MIDGSVLTALRAHESEALLQFLRTILAAEQLTGVGTANSKQQESAINQARALSLVRQTREGRFRLTAVGYEIANFAKEYRNWVELGRVPPEGVDQQLVAGKRVLDVGCSTGRHMATFSRMGARPIGIELQENYLHLSRFLAEREGVDKPVVLRATAARLPFASRSFDVVFCRLVINYCPVKDTLAEFARVLAPGGLLVLTFETFGRRAGLLREIRWRGNLRTVAFNLFGHLNAIVMQLTGRQVSIPARGRMSVVYTNSWPTRGWFRRQLIRQGFNVSPTAFFSNERSIVFRGRRLTTATDEPTGSG